MGTKKEERERVCGTMDRKEYIYTTIRMPVDSEMEKQLKYVEAYTPCIPKKDWKRMNYQISWFTKGKLSWYWQTFKCLFFKKCSKPKRMTVQADICIKDNIDEVNRILCLPGTVLIETKPEYVEKFGGKNNGNKNSVGRKNSP